MNQKNTYRILLIDDQETIHQDYRKVLGTRAQQSVALAKAATELFDDDPSPLVDWEGFELDSALQGEQGFELVQKSIEEGRPYALAFVDIRMPPGWDGVQTVRRIWEIDPEILIVICSAYSDYSWEEMVQQLGRNDRFLILKKPFDNIEVRQSAMALTERWGVSRSDVLTGLLNRRAFDGHLQLEWRRAHRHGLQLACALVDLDYFKRVNDTLGHTAGDLVLKAIAQRLQAACRATDFVCRYGGEEFCVLMPHTDEQGAAIWAENTREAIAAADVTIDGRSIQVTASIGISERLEQADTAEELISRADQALLVAKELGRNRLTRFSSMGDPAESLREELRNRANLFQGLTAKQVMTAPVASLRADATAGEAAEFFLRFRINSAPIVNQDGMLIGMLSEKDVIGMLLGQDAWSTPIGRIMQRNVICYEEQTSVQSICEFLSRVAVRRVVIVRDGRPTGVVSRGSLLRWYSNWIKMQKQGALAGLDSDNAPARLRLIQGAQAIARCAVELSDSVSVSAQADDLVPPVIEGVSRLQELIQDLFACSRRDMPVIVGDGTLSQTSGLLGSPSAIVG
ncbi:MAG: diguanylate cyclase [Planctomycetia bacterium]|nr:diguanylate cyclase [Planctomycetia bacterium]